MPSFVVNLFFVVSGFLVTASYINRNNLRSFLLARALRIYPALFVAVVLSVVLGFFVSSLSFSEFFYSSSTYSYILKNFTLISGVQFDLPGVFLNNPYPISVTALCGLCL